MCVYAYILFGGFLLPKQYSSTRPAASDHHTINPVLSDTVFASFENQTFLIDFNNSTNSFFYSDTMAGRSDFPGKINQNCT
jgi:hypothetical protein